VSAAGGWDRIGHDGPLRGVVAGAGALGPYWARELVASPDTELVGWADLDPARARAAAEKLGARGLPVDGSIEKLLEAQEPDFLVNVTAPAAHHDVTIAALDRGVAVVSEKPMAATLPEALAMVEAAERNRRLFMVSQNRRYKPTLQAFREVVAGLGPLSSLTCDFYRAHREAQAAFLYTFAQPLLLDMAIHLFDGARAISGTDPLSVYCESYDPPGTWYAGPAAATAIFRMTDDVRFTFTGNWAADGFTTSWTGTWRVVGALGSATWDGDSAPEVEGSPTAPLRAPVVSDPPEREGRFAGLEGALADFVAGLRTGAVPPGECHDNLRSLAMCHAAVDSAARGVPVPVPAG
jgi:predicted dehydrogenase